MEKRDDDKYFISNSLSRNIIRNIVMAKSLDKNMDISFLKNEDKFTIFKEIIQDIILKTYDEDELEILDKYSHSDMTFLGKDSSNPINVMFKEIDDGFNDSEKRDELFASVDDKIFYDIYNFSFNDFYLMSKSLFDGLNQKYGSVKETSQFGE